MAKTESALRTITEVSLETGVAQHILRYWETRFPQLRPLQRAGNRRYYRTDDIALVRRIDGLLNREGYTIKGVQKLLGEGAPMPTALSPAMPLVDPSPVAGVTNGTPAIAASTSEPAAPALLLAELRAIRDTLADALATDAALADTRATNTP